MKIAIYEPIHLECVFPYCDLFSQRGDKVSFFTSAAFENDLKDVLGMQYSEFEFTFFDVSESRLLFWRKLNSFVNSGDFDLIILNSVDYRHLMIYNAVRSRTSCIVINIHDVNNFFKPEFSLHPRKLLRSIGKKLLAKRATAFFVHTKAMQEYIISNCYTTKQVFFLSPAIAKAKFPAFDRKPFVITVPGAIDEKRRNYKFVLDVFTTLSKIFPQEIKLVLAGRPVGRFGSKILQKAQELKQQGLLISFYEQEIPEITFRKIIQETTLLWSPLCINTSIHDNINEIYGITKMSGNIHDAIRYGKPLMTPDELYLPEEISSGCINYSSKTDAEQKLEFILKNKGAFQRIAIKAVENAQNYSLSNSLSTLEHIFQKLNLNTPNSQT